MAPAEVHCPCSRGSPATAGEAMDCTRRKRRRLQSSSSLPRPYPCCPPPSASLLVIKARLSRSQPLPPELSCSPPAARTPPRQGSARLSLIVAVLLSVSFRRPAAAALGGTEPEAGLDLVRSSRSRRLRGRTIRMRRRRRATTSADVDFGAPVQLSPTLGREDGPSTFVSAADSVEKTTRHVTHCEKQALEYNNTHVNMSLVPSMRSAAAAADGAPGGDGGGVFAPRSAEVSSNNKDSDAAVARCSGGFAYDAANRIRYPCRNVDLLSFIPLTTMHQAVSWRYGPDNGYGIGNDVWGWTHASSGREFALMGMAYGTAIVEVTEPVRPTYLGLLAATDYKRNKWHDIKVKRNVAYIVSEQSDHGLQVFDLTRLLDLSPSYSRVLRPDSVLKGARWFGKSHNLVINQGDDDSNLLIAVGVDTRFCDGGMFIMDISRPLSPTKKACYGKDGYVHDAECVTYQGPDRKFQGREICFAYNEDTVTIVDVDAPHYEDGFIRILSRYDDPYDRWVYTHQGSLTEDMKYILLDDEGDESARNIQTTTYVLDVSLLQSPRYVGEHRSANSATDHNQYIVGPYSYQANYDAGLRILRIDDPDNPRTGLVEEAYFDIEPGRDSSEMKGAWSVYPYFSSGTVLVSSTEEGLYMLRPNLKAAPCPRSSEGCVSNSLYINDFLTGGKSYSRIKPIAQPSIPRGGNGGFVGRISIPDKRKRQVAFEDVDINVVGSRSIQLIANIGLMKSAPRRYKFSMKVFFDNNEVKTTPRTMLGSSAHESFQYYMNYVGVPFGAQSIVKVEYRIVKPAKNGDKNILLIDSLSINKDVRGSVGAVAARSAETVKGDGYNVFRFKAPREGSL
mmetsp:Transcript_2368/g.6871  ORF Transcript_2368/g.6871 Transcript_2368/m.6871 type:complete len:847 (-) Transcript_2368:55-2595(-)